MGADALATAVIAAAGSGDRLGAGGPKALVEVAGSRSSPGRWPRSQAAERVGAIVIAAPPGHEEEVRSHGAGAQRSSPVAPPAPNRSRLR